MQVSLPPNEEIIECAKEAASRDGYENFSDPRVQAGRLRHGQVHTSEWYVTMNTQKQAKSVTIRVTVKLASGLNIYAEPKIDEIK